MAIVSNFRIRLLAYSRSGDKNPEFSMLNSGNESERKGKGIARPEGLELPTF
jgi:hypothetical protein